MGYEFKFEPTTGDDLDRLVGILGIERRKWWIFRESDKRLRARANQQHKNPLRGRPAGVSEFWYRLALLRRWFS